VTKTCKSNIARAERLANGTKQALRAALHSARKFGDRTAKLQSALRKAAEVECLCAELLGR
jgi:hypothetical protein